MEQGVAVLGGRVRDRGDLVVRVDPVDEVGLDDRGVAVGAHVEIQRYGLSGWRLILIIFRPVLELNIQRRVSSARQFGEINAHLINSDIALNMRAAISALNACLA